MRVILISILLMSMVGCSSIDISEREAHHENAKIYIPMLKQYLNKDQSIDEDAKEVHLFTLDMWKELIDTKYEGSK